GHMGLFVYTQKGSIISMVVLPTTEIIEPKSSSTRPRCVKMQPRTLRREARQKAQPHCFCISIDGGGITLFGTFLKQLQP
ncbi:MAG: hypothetical protein WBO81_07680, partial [Streptococcus suis]